MHESYHVHVWHVGMVMMTSESGACLTEPNKEQSPASGDCILDKLSDHSTAESHIATLNAVDSNHYSSTV